MKKKKITQPSGLIAISLLNVFLLVTETCGANPKSSENQITQIPKTAYKQSGGERLKAVKRTTADPSTFRPDMPFSEAIDILRNSTVPPLNIAVLWKDLEENAAIYKETPIGMDGLSRVPLRTHLKVLLMSVSGGGVEKLGYTVDDGVITIATQGSLPRKVVTRIYDVTDLVSEPANYRLMPGFGMPFGFGAMPLGGMMPFGGAGYGRQGFSGASGPYRSTSRGAFIGASSVRTNLNAGSYASGSAGGYRGHELVDLIETLYGSGSRNSYSNNIRIRANR